MQKHFYTHLIEVESIYTVLDLLEMSTDERKELMIIVDSTVHHVILDTVLTELSEEDKKSFLSHLAQDNHEEIWTLLNNKMKQPEKKIKKAVDKVKKDFHSDMKRVMSKRK
jgi:succinate dehydrogenase flavin-adding protein (antitoxin of CptAB toxin-antitoxin module)